VKCKRETCAGKALRTGNLCEKHWRMEKALGLRGRVPADRASAHLDVLLAAGWTKKDVADAVGLWVTTVHKIRPGVDIHATTEPLILALRPEDSPNSSRSSHDATGFTRRVNGLLWMGHPVNSYAHRLGVSAGRVHNVKWLGRVSLGLHNRMVEVYDDLHFVPGPSWMTAAKARAMGHIPPFAWDTIDDPAAEPQGLRSVSSRRTYASTAEEYTHFKSLGMSDHAIARALGLRPDSLSQALLRARRAAA
jgi:hypothetical protein